MSLMFIYLNTVMPTKFRKIQDHLPRHVYNDGEPRLNSVSLLEWKVTSIESVNKIANHTTTSLIAFVVSISHTFSLTSLLLGTDNNTWDCCTLSHFLLVGLWKPCLLIFTSYCYIAYTIFVIFQILYSLGFCSHNK